MRKKLDSSKKIYGIISLSDIIEGSKDFNKVPAFVGLFVFAVGILLSFILSNNFKIQDTTKTEKTQIKQLGVITNYISYKSAQYEQILSSGASLFNIQEANNISQEDWSKYVASIQTSERYPGILAIGYAEQVNESDKENYINSIRDTGDSDFNIFPASTKPQHTVVKYIEPANDKNRSYIGLDLLTNDIQKDTILSARDSGVSAMTMPFTSLNPTLDRNTKSEDPSTLVNAVYYPVYGSVTQPDSELSRSNAIKGYVYIIFNVNTMMNSAGDQLISIQTPYTLHYKTENSSTLLYSFLYDNSLEADEKRQKSTEDIRAIDQSWTLSVYDEIIAPEKSLEPILIFLIGILVSFIISSSGYWLIKRRFNTLQARHEKEIQRTKDDLLALASHQLRTPATGVKQYLGMLMKGYFGKLNDKQKDNANKAYLANDRQLEIIDQLLYVAKADAGQLHVESYEFDLIELIDQIVESLADVSNGKNIEIKINSPKKLIVYADGRYLRMIIENLVSNAIKYSYRDSMVQIIVKKSKENISVKVSDTGVGIDKAQQYKLFQKFSRLDNPLSKSEKGSGLGLYLSQKLALSHGGKITFQHNQPKGTSFTLKMPRSGQEDNKVIKLSDN